MVSSAVAINGRPRSRIGWPSRSRALWNSVDSAVISVAICSSGTPASRTCGSNPASISASFAVASCFVGEPLPVEQVLDPNIALLLLGVGVTATFGQLCLTRAFTAGEPARVSLVALTQIVFAIGLDLLFDPQPFDNLTLAGIVLVMAPTAWVMAGRAAE